MFLLRQKGHKKRDSRKRPRGQKTEKECLTEETSDSESETYDEDSSSCILALGFKALQNDRNSDDVKKLIDSGTVLSICPTQFYRKRTDTTSRVASSDAEVEYRSRYLMKKWLECIARYMTQTSTSDSERVQTDCAVWDLVFTGYATSNCPRKTRTCGDESWIRNVISSP